MSHQPNEKLILIDEIYKRYCSGNQKLSMRFLWKKYLWLSITQGSRLLKRIIDVIASFSALILLLPLFMVLALLIYIHDKGPVLFWQSRVGKWGREFPFPKFRSMVMNAEEIKDQLLSENDHEDSITFKIKKDPRITPVGRFIRKFSLDEFPQFWCVLIGDMSLVGPRPPVPREVAQYSLKDRRRLDIKPGLTCIWQVSGRGDIPFDQQVDLDIQYINSQSFFLDLKLLFLTVPAVLLGKGAY